MARSKRKPTGTVFKPTKKFRRGNADGSFVTQAAIQLSAMRALMAGFKPVFRKKTVRKKRTRRYKRRYTKKRTYKRRRRRY